MKWFNFSSLSHEIKAQRGASMMELILAIALVMALAPYMYYRISETSQEITNVGIAKKIVTYEARAMNYVRLNQNFWTGTARIEMDAEEANVAFGTDAEKNFSLTGAFINKYQTKDGTAFDVFLGFDIPGANDMRIAQIARMIGGNAGTVIDGGAYGIYGNWSARSGVFLNGNLVYRISENMANQDSEKFLHRTVLGDEKFNSMERDLSLGGNVVYDAGEVIGESARITNATALFANADFVSARELVFPNGANIDPANSRFKSIRVIGDIVGFRNISVRNLKGRGGTGSWARQGSVVADRATVSDAVHVGKNLYIRTNSARTISGFTGAIAHSVYTPYISTEELYFSDGFGLTISSELISSSFGSPLKLGAWNFPSNSMPKFSVLKLVRLENADVAMKSALQSKDFIKMLESGWKDLRAKQGTVEIEE